MRYIVNGLSSLTALEFIIIYNLKRFLFICLHEKQEINNRNVLIIINKQLFIIKE